MGTLWNSFVNTASSFSDSVFLSLIKEDRFKYLTDGLIMTLEMTMLAALIGIVIGLFLAIAKLQDVDNLTGNRIVIGLRKWLTGFANGYISVVRGTPAVVQLLIINFVIFAQLQQNVTALRSISSIWIAGIAFGINSGAYVAEIIRAGIMAVDKGQSEAGRSLGLSASTTMASIIIPQAIKNVLPALCNEFITLLKETSVAGYIGIMDLTKGATTIGAVIYNYMVPLICAAYIYFLMTTALSTGIGTLERRLHKSD